MNNNLVGVQYIGGKPIKTDNVCNTGAVWNQYQTLNFSTELAAKLCIHKDVFLLADFEDGAPIYSAQIKTNLVPVREYKDINSMTLESLKTFAKAEFSKSIDGDETDVEKVRAQVLAYTRERNATDDFELKTKNEPNILSLQVNDSEYKAYLAGGLELKLIPTNVQLDPVQTDEPVNQAFLGEDAAEKATKEVTPVEVKEEAKTDELPTLPELLGKLDKSGLLKLAKENGVKVANTMPAEVLREKLLGALVK